ncbi:MAG: c-type cytochrome [Caldilineaceae bacterium]
MSAGFNEPNGNPITPEESLHIDWWEAMWIRITIVVLIIFTGAVFFASTQLGIQLPGVHMRINPNTLNDPAVSPFANPEVKMVAEGEYEAYVRAQIWLFTPGEIHIPVGSKLTLYVTSQDVQHGFKIDRTNVNMMVLPGQVSKLSHRFTEPGIYNFICHEYCGVGHHTMYGRIIVEDAAMIASETATAEAVAAAASTPVPSDAQAAAPIGDPEKGKVVFTTCAACHGPNGQGVQGLGKPFTTSEFIATKTDAELVEFLKVGRPVGDPLNTTGVAMPPKGGNPALTDQDLFNVVAYVRTLHQ